jgi:hypothetical protein
MWKDATFSVPPTRVQTFFGKTKTDGEITVFDALDVFPQNGAQVVG